ncbi:MAG: cation:proton antiporter [Spirochaetaceae bacterium]|nr:cation:proton antiporter [Spirochaetaceae bacterium]
MARPIACFLILKGFKCSIRQIALISFSGIRGASSIVFAIIATISVKNFQYDIFHIVFCIVLFSIAFQGTLLPVISKKLKMIDEKGDVLKTFTDYQEENEIQFIRLYVSKSHPGNRFMIKNILLPPEVLILIIIRDKERIIPNGNTLIKEEDILIIAAPGFKDDNNIVLSEVVITKDHDWITKEIRNIELNPNSLIAIVKRGNKVIIPRGNTQINDKDIMVVLNNRP